MVWSTIIPKDASEAIELDRADCRAFLRNAMASDTDALQFFHSFANVGECYVLRDVRNSNAWRDDEADFSGFEFLVEFYRIENFLSRKFRR